MNRQDRRQAQRKGRNGYGSPGDHLDCGCHNKTLTAMSPLVCPQCGEKSSVVVGSFVFPTSSPAGSVMTLEIGCACGAEYQAQFAVT